MTTIPEELSMTPLTPVVDGGGVLRFEGVHGIPTAQDLHVATLMLLLGAAHSDHSIEAEELTTIAEQMRGAFDLPRSEVEELLDLSRQFLNDTPYFEGMLSKIGTFFDQEQRREICRMVWQVIAANGSVEPGEALFASRIRERLNLSLEEAVRARTLVELEAF